MHRLRVELVKAKEQVQVLTLEKSLLAADYCALSVAKVQDH